MQDNAENISSALSNAASSKAATGGLATTLTAGGVVATAKDPAIIGNYFATNGLFFLSWIEIFQAIGCIYITYKLIEIIIHLTKKLIIATRKFATYCCGFKRQPIKVKSKSVYHGSNHKT